MLPTSIGAILGVTSAIAWGISDYFATKASRSNSPEAVSLWVSVLSTFIFCSILVMGHDKHLWSQSAILFSITAGVCLELGLYLLFQGLELGPVSVVTPVSSAYPIIATVVTVFLFQDSLNTKQAAGILVTMFGIVLASGLLLAKKKELRVSKGVYKAFGTFLLWGLAYSLLAESVARMGWEKTTAIDTATGLIFLLLIFRLTKVKLKIISRNTYLDKLVISTALTQITGGIVFAIALSHAHSVAVIITIAACYPAVTVLFAILKLHERVKASQLIGAAITVSGILILSM